MAKKNTNEILEEIKVCITNTLKMQAPTPESYMQAYGLIYSYCSSKVKIDCSLTKSRDSNQLNIYGRRLYETLNSIFTQHFNNISKKLVSSRDVIVNIYLDNWNMALKSSKSVDSMCAHMNRHWIKREQLESSSQVCSIYQLIIILWTQLVFLPFKDELFEAIFYEINLDRQNLESNMEKVADFTKHLLYLCLHTFPPITENTPVIKSYVFETHFEPDFINMTKLYYESFSNQAFQNNSTLEYISIIKKWFEMEEKRVKSYIHKDLIIKTRETLEDVLIRPRLKSIYFEFDRMLSLRRSEDILQIYRVIGTQEAVSNELRSIFNQHIRKVAIEAFVKLGDPETMDPTIFVKRCTDILTKYQTVILNSFDANKLFKESKDSAFTYSLNNCYSKSSVTTNPASKLLAKCADIYLSKQPYFIPSFDVLSNLQKITEIFSYLDDKESFKKYFLEFSAQRFIHNLSTSNEAESSFISLLKNTVDNDYVSEMQKMLSDISLSNEDVAKFRQEFPNISNNFISYSFLVLTASAWPLTFASDLNPPSIVENVIEKYQDFYLSTHKGRKLKWLYDISTVEMEFIHNDKSYTLILSLFQASILDLFNKQLIYKVSELIDLTKISIEIISKVIISLINSHILMLVPTSSSSSSSSSSSPPSLTPTLDLSLEITYNKNFNYAGRILDINKQLSHIPLPITGDKKYNQMDKDPVIQAAIVRVIKKSKKLITQILIDTVYNELFHRFNVSKEAIQKNIDNLFERGFVSVCPEDSNVLRYCS